jgi:hypothetical protein
MNDTKMFSFMIIRGLAFGIFYHNDIGTLLVAIGCFSLEINIEGEFGVEFINEYKE